MTEDSLNGQELSRRPKGGAAEPELRDTWGAPTETARHSGGTEAARPLVTSGWSTSFRLFVRARRGESSAVDRLFARLLPNLQRWARGKLPRWARRRVDTADLVQEAFLHFFHHLGHIEPRRHRALRAYLQESIRNRIRDEVRRAGLVETSEVPGAAWPDRGTSPLERAIAQEKATRYREALRRLDANDQELIVGRIELGFSYEQLAVATGRPSPDAARVAVRRALLQLAKEM